MGTGLKKINSTFIFASLLSSFVSASAWGYSCASLVDPNAFFPPDPGPISLSISETEFTRFKEELPQAYATYRRLGWMDANGKFDLSRLSLKVNRGGANPEYLLFHSSNQAEAGTLSAGVFFSGVTHSGSPGTSLLIQSKDSNIHSIAQATFLKVFSEGSVEKDLLTVRRSRFNFPGYTFELQATEVGKKTKSYSVVQPKLKSYYQKISPDGKIYFPGLGNFAHFEDDLLDFIFARYRARMNLMKSDEEVLRLASLQVMERSTFISANETPFLLWKDGLDFSQPFQEQDLIRANLGGIVIVESKNASERLPSEIFTNENFPRPPHGSIAELGRFAVAEGREAEFSEELIQIAVAKIVGERRILEVVIEADEVRARRFRTLGFEPFIERVNFQGKKEYMMKASTKTLYERVVLPAIKRGQGL